MPRISIVMPVFNSAEYLEESIISILNQTYTDWEFLIINEFGSNDGSKEIVEKYAKIDKRIILIQNKTRLGIAESMNVGLNIAKGEYIARMDADDISMPERFETQLKYLDENQDVVMCGVKVQIFGSNPFEWKLECDKEKLSTNILFYSPSVHPTVMVRKSFLDKYNIKYNKEYRASEDYDLFSKICEKGKVANVNQILFKYRIMENNATFKNNDIGLVIYNDIMKRQFERLGLEFNEQELKLLSPHYSMKGAKGREVISRLIQLDLLLKKILVANAKLCLYNQDCLMNTLNKRYKEAYDSIAWSCSNVDFNKASMIYEKSIFKNDKFYHSENLNKNYINPQVTVLIPTFNSEKYLMDTLWSLLEQTYSNYEILILNEFGSDDDTVFIANMFNDSRIKVIQNQEKLGLAESLNLGIRIARGKYLARMDADDLCSKHRLQLQFEFLESNKEYGIVGSWQHHFGIDTDWIHKCSVSNEDLEAELLYNCDLCHSTLMLRKSYFIEHQLYYDNTYAAEDYELWTRAIRKFKIANIPQVLGEYRVGEDNITAQKEDILSQESGEIVANNLNYYFNIVVPTEHIGLLSGWKNEFNKLTKVELKKALNTEKKVILAIWKENNRINKMNTNSLLKTLNKRWRMITNTWEEDGIVFSIDELFEKATYGHARFVKNISRIKRLSVKRFIKKCLGRIYRPIKYRTIDVVQQQIWDLDGHLNDLDGHLYDYKEEILQEIQDEVRCRINIAADEITVTMKKHIESTFQNIMIEYSNQISASVEQVVDKQLLSLKEEIDSQIVGLLKQKNFEEVSERLAKNTKSIIDTVDTRIWKAELNMTEKLDKQDKILDKLDSYYTDRAFEVNKVWYNSNDKIRVVFLFQIASFWPSWESLYNFMMNDERFEVTIILYNEIINEKTQMRTAREFLLNNEIPFIEYSENILDYITPHILVMQTPYDEWHRSYELWSENIRAKGIRIIYIPYGLEIGDTVESRKYQYNTKMMGNCWRIYTLSELMKECYQKYSANGAKVRALGHPKFDTLIEPEVHLLSGDLIGEINGRRVCLWKVHFPQKMQVDNVEKIVTPSIEEYIKFAEYITKVQDVYFIFMPHPKFMEMCKWIVGAEEKAKLLFEILNESNNATVFTEDDYRPAVLAADFAITDRSSLMIEIGVNNIPTMFVSNPNYFEPLSEGIKELVSSYIQGNTAEDMISFVEDCLNGVDTNKEIREKAFNKCVPYTDGKCGIRIIEDITTSLQLEAD